MELFATLLVPVSEPRAEELKALTNARNPEGAVQADDRCDHGFVRWMGFGAHPTRSMVTLPLASSLGDRIAVEDDVDQP